MDSKGGSLPAMPEPKNPTSMKQLSGSPCGLGDGSTDPDLLMNKVATQLAATPCDGVLQKIGNHSHEHLKDLTSRLLNGDQDKMGKFCTAPPSSPIVKGTESGLQHGSPQRKANSSPELTLKITHVANGKSPPKSMYEASYGEEGTHEPDPSLNLAEGILVLDTNAGIEKRKRAPVKKKLPPSKRPPSGPSVKGSNTFPVLHSATDPACDHASLSTDQVTSTDILPSESHDAVDANTFINVTSDAVVSRDFYFLSI